MGYKTVAGYGKYEITVNKSRFIGYVNYAESEEDALNFIKEIKKKHSDARHNVYAYVISENRKRYSDDGEPQGTAGLPILNVIESNECLHCVVVVTRYFGGILLGTGGLHRAYTEACDGALKATKIVNMTDCATYTVKCDYSYYSKLELIISRLGGTKPEVLFEDRVTLRFAVPCESSDTLERGFREATNNNIFIVRGENRYVGL